jgi:hypothetical protein
VESTQLTGPNTHSNNNLIAAMQTAVQEGIKFRRYGGSQHNRPKIIFEHRFISALDMSSGK